MMVSIPTQPICSGSNPGQAGQVMPVSRIPIVDESLLCKTKPDYPVILPWKLKAEVIQQLKYSTAWDGRFVNVIPELQLAL